MRRQPTRSENDADNGARTVVFVIIMIAAVASAAAAMAWLSPAYQYLSCTGCHM